MGALFRRDLVLGLRAGGGALTGLLFFLAVIATIPFGVGPDLGLLARIGPAILWIGALLAGLLGLDRLFQADRSQGGIHLEQRGAKEALPEQEVLGEAQRRLQGVQVAEIVAGGADARPVLGVFAFEADAPFGRRQQPGHDPQQGGFAGAVGTCHQERVAGAERKADAEEDGTAAAFAAQILGVESHAVLVLSDAVCRRACIAATLPFVAMELCPESRYMPNNHASGRRGNRICAEPARAPP